MRYWSRELSSKFCKHLRQTNDVNLSGSCFQHHCYKVYRDLVHGDGLRKRKGERNLAVAYHLLCIKITPGTIPSGDNYSLPSSDAATAGSHEPSGSDTRNPWPRVTSKAAALELKGTTAQEISPRQQDFAAEPVETALVVDTDIDRAIESDTESADTDDEWVAPRLFYSPTGDDGARHFSRVTIVNASSIDYNSRAPRPARKPRGLASAAQSASVAPRNDALAVAVRYSARLVQTNEVAIRSARQAALEYTLARDMPMKTQSPGWGRRPAHGKTYRATYVREFQRGCPSVDC